MSKAYLESSNDIKDDDVFSMASDVISELRELDQKALEQLTGDINMLFKQNASILCIKNYFFIFLYQKSTPPYFK